MLSLKVKENIQRDIVILTIPKREKQIGELLVCLSELNSKKFNIILVCNTPRTIKSEAFTKNITKKTKLPYQILYNPEKTIASGRNVGVLQSIKNMDQGTRLTYFIDDDILIYKAKELFSILERGLNYTAFLGYPAFEVSGLKHKKSEIVLNDITKKLMKGKLDSESLEFLKLEKPRSSTPFQGERYELARILYGHVHGNLLLFYTKVLEKVMNDFDKEHIFNPSRKWYGEWTELNYKLQRLGFMGGYFYRSPNNWEHLYNAEKWGLLIHNKISTTNSPTRNLITRNKNMLKAYISLAIESNVIPFNISKKEFAKEFLKLLNYDFRFIKKKNREFAKLLQLRYSTKRYLFGKTDMANHEFVIEREKLIMEVLDSIYGDNALRDELIKTKVVYETAPFELSPFQQLTRIKLKEFLRYQNDALRSFREEIYENQ